MTVLVVRGDAAHLPLPDASVDLIVTSPPYFGLRSYTDGGEHYDGQIGSEGTPAEYVAALLACTAEWVRVLKGSGSLWVNLGDKYAGDPRTNTATLNNESASSRWSARGGRHVEFGKLRPKSLLGLPWRYALGCIDQLGLILRAEVIWSKPNGLPESVTDRVRRSHEQWFHFTKQPRYYSAVDEIREPHVATVTGRDMTGWAQGPSGNREIGRGQWDGTRQSFAVSPLGKLPGSVWEIPSQPLTVPAHLGVDHFAAFPMELPRRIIQGWSPPGTCTECGEGRRPIVDKPGLLGGDNNTERLVNGRYVASGFNGGQKNWQLRMAQPDRITGYTCACPDATAATRPAVVLDPFGGTGTTALIATALGRTGISIDRSADYCRLALWRTTDPGQRAAAMQVDKPPRQIDGQGDLFDSTDLSA